MESQNESLAIDQVAEIAVRMRRLFADIDPADPSVALAIQSSFTRQVVITSDFEEKLKVRIAEFDLDSTAEVKLYYARLMATWLHQKGSRG